MRGTTHSVFLATLVLLQPVALQSATNNPLASTAAPIVSQLHVLSIHVPDSAKFDAVCRLLGEGLGLPKVYGEPSQPPNNGKRNYAGFSVGNAYLEPCGPYAGDPPFTVDQPVRFCGLTFDPAKSLDVAAQVMAERGIPRSEITGAAGRFSLFQTTDTNLTGRYQAVGLWEIKDPQDCLTLKSVKSLLEQANGGPLGVKRLAEIRLKCAGSASMRQWANFLAPAKRDGNLLSVGEGPVFRLIPVGEQDDNSVEGVVIEVESLDRARRVLEPKAMLRPSAFHGLELRPG